MDANRIVREAAEQAMVIGHFREKGLAEYLGCSEKSIRRILEEEPVKMIQEQYIRLLLLERKL